MVNTSDHLSIFLHTLVQSGFKGDCETTYGARIVASTDNSIYQVIPEAILYPANADDINFIVASVARQPQKSISITPRGGGTGTNGQSLNRNVIVDTSRYLRNIIDFDESNRQVCVEPGVVLDQLNEFLKPYGLFFPANVSTSSRATIGGMVATDASGKGSRIYGKTSAYIEQLEVVLADGSDYSVKPTPIDSLSKLTDQSLGDRLQYQVYNAVIQHRDEIERVFPDLNRGLTGYNLKQVLGGDDLFRMSYLLAGSEGTLAFTKSIRLNLIPLPKFKALVVVLYDDYLKALRHVAELCASDPAAIEILDDKLIAQAQRDSVWQDIQAVFREQPLDQSYQAMNFIEVIGDSEDSIRRQCEKFETHIKNTSEAYGVVGSLVETDANAIASLWDLRSRAVGLLAMLDGDTQGLAFVEDSTVPPQQLADYVEKFRAILDAHQIDYAMYGHADVGCLHVRPMLDMTQQSDRDMIRSITDAVAALVKQYGGLLWGEHGRGYRGEYSPMFFGAHLMPVLHAIKTAFDPENVFNPGKLAVSDGSPYAVEKIDEVPFRGTFDQQIEPEWARQYDSAIKCNGNATCFSWQVNDAMCPSYKATKDKTLSPKGRAAMLREWARLQSVSPESTLIPALEDELYRSLNACLSCKSCSYSCPLKVDIPDLKSSFLQHYHQRHRRKLRDSIFAGLESFSAIASLVPGLANIVTQNPLSKTLLRSVFGIVSAPRFSVSLRKGLAGRNAIRLHRDSLPGIDSGSDNQLILLPDSFNAGYSAEVLLAAYDFLQKLGYEVLVAPLLPSGKALHVKGFRDKFKRQAINQVEQVKRLAATGRPLLSVEIVTRLMHEKEYAEMLENPPDYRIWSIEHWLATQIKEGKLELAGSSYNAADEEYLLLPHCMEQTADRQSAQDWQTIFASLGLCLTIKNAGCCGMAGLFGHERENQGLSDDIFRLNWQGITSGNSKKLLASGFSCRCQLHRHGLAVDHPLTKLSKII
ncbi:MAG: FAD-binding and (Fe-S)-binding domain-containing protein [Gammaproteobacteria bacterium]|nr:FAD-binding and (Fe-S)-binding domain-containing protein [Gammaproteobacteria bacterium]